MVKLSYACLYSEFLVNDFLTQLHKVIITKDESLRKVSRKD